MSKTNKTADMRVSVTVHLSAREALLVEAAAARAGLSRHDLVRHRLLAREVDDAPVLACLARLIAIHHRLDRLALLDPDLRAEIFTAIQDLLTAAREEVAP